MSAPLTAGVRRALWRIPVIVAEDGYATDDYLCAELGVDFSEVRTAVAILWRQRRIDRVVGYLVAPAAPREPITLPDAPGRAA